MEKKCWCELHSSSLAIDALLVPCSCTAFQHLKSHTCTVSALRLQTMTYSVQAKKAAANRNPSSQTAVKALISKSTCHYYKLLHSLTTALDQQRASLEQAQQQRQWEEEHHKVRPWACDSPCQILQQHAHSRNNTNFTTQQLPGCLGTGIKVQSHLQAPSKCLLAHVQLQNRVRHQPQLRSSSSSKTLRRWLVKHGWEHLI
jgi:hypothetical protein